MSGQTSLEISRGRWPNGSIQILGEGSRLLLDNTSEGIAIVQDGVMKLVNRSFLRLIDYSRTRANLQAFPGLRSSR